MDKKKKKKAKVKAKSKRKKVISVFQETGEKETSLKRKKRKKKKKKVKDVQEKKTETEEIMIHTTKRKSSEKEPEWRESTEENIYQNKSQKKIRTNSDSEREYKENDSDVGKIKILAGNDSNKNKKVKGINEKMKKFDDEEEDTTDHLEFAHMSKNDCLSQQSNLLALNQKEDQFQKHCKKEKDLDKLTKKKISVENYEECYESDRSKKLRGQEVRVKEKSGYDRRIIKLEDSDDSTSGIIYESYDYRTENVTGKKRTDEMGECTRKFKWIDAANRSDNDRRTKKFKGHDSKVRDKERSSSSTHKSNTNCDNRNIHCREMDQIIGSHKSSSESDSTGDIIKKAQNSKNWELTQMNPRKNKNKREQKDKSEIVSSRKLYKERSDYKYKDKDKKEKANPRGKHGKHKNIDNTTKNRKEEKPEVAQSRKNLEGSSEGKTISRQIGKEKHILNDAIEKSNEDSYNNEKYVIKSNKISETEKSFELNTSVVSSSSSGSKETEKYMYTDCEDNQKLKSVIEKNDGKYVKMETKDKKKKSDQHSLVDYEGSSPLPVLKKREQRSNSVDDSLNQESSICSEDTSMIKGTQKCRKMNVASTQDKSNRKRKCKQELGDDEEVVKVRKRRKKISRSYDDDDDDDSIDQSPKSVVIRKRNDITHSSKHCGNRLHERKTQVKKYDTNIDDTEKRKENKWRKEKRIYQSNKESIIMPESQSRKCAEKFVDDTTYRERHVKLKQDKEIVNQIEMDTDRSSAGIMKDDSPCIISEDENLLDNGKRTNEVKRREISMINKMDVLSEDKGVTRIRDEISQNRKNDEDLLICKAEQSDKSLGHSPKYEKNGDVNLSSGEVHSNKELEIKSLKTQKPTLSTSLHNHCYDGKKEKPVRKFKELQKENENKPETEGDYSIQESDFSPKHLYEGDFSPKHLCDRDFQTAETETDTVNEKTKKVKSVIGIVSIPTSIPSAPADKVRADFEDKRSPSFCKSQSVRKIMHEELFNMKRSLDSDIENSREDRIKLNIENTLLEKHKNMDLNLLYEDLSDEEMDSEKSLQSKNRENNLVECDKANISEKMSEIDSASNLTSKIGESQARGIQPKKRNSFFNIDIDYIIKRVSKKEDVFKTRTVKKQKNQNINDDEKRDLGSRKSCCMQSSSERSEECLYSAKEGSTERKSESDETSISRGSKCSTMDSKEKYETGYSLNISDGKMKSCSYSKEKEIRGSSKKRRKEKDYYDEKYHSQRKRRKKCENVERNRKTRSRSLEKNDGDEVASRDQYNKKRYSKGRECSETWEVNDCNEKENNWNKFKLGEMYSDRIEECKQFSPVVNNENCNDLYTPLDKNKNTSFCSTQDEDDDREKKFSNPVTYRSLQLSPVDSYRNEKRCFSSSKYSPYLDSNDKYSYSRGNRSFDYPSSASSSYNFNRNYDFSSSPMFRRNQFNSPFERSSNRGLNSTISSTPGRPRFRIPSYKELTGHENEVEEDYSDDKKEDFELFWRIQSPFSQFHPAKFEVRGVWYNCAEQFFMHQKACEYRIHYLSVFGNIFSLLARHIILSIWCQFS